MPRHLLEWISLLSPWRSIELTGEDAPSERLGSDSFDSESNFSIVLFLVSFITNINCEERGRTVLTRGGVR